MDNSGKRPIARQWLALHAELTPAERQAARGYVLAQRYPRGAPAAPASSRRWWIFPRTYPAPIVLGAPASPRQPVARSGFARQLAGLAALCCLALIGVSAIGWGPALAHAWLVAMLPLASTAPAAAGVLAVWSAVVAFPLGLSVLGTHAALRQAAVVLGG